jgi:hypothetical protein
MIPSPFPMSPSGSEALFLCSFFLLFVFFGESVSVDGSATLSEILTSLLICQKVSDNKFVLSLF